RARRRPAQGEIVGLSREHRRVRHVHRLPALPLQLHPGHRPHPAQHLRPVRDRSRRPRISPASQTPPDPLRPPAMQRLTLAGGIPESLKGSVLALGNFDGFHLGHQAVVSRAVARAFHERRPVIVATFDPHPVRHFKADVPPFRLTTLDQRERLFAHAGADAMLVCEFGYPTANVELGDYQRPRYGIYAVRVTLEDASEHPGVASLGVRPTFEPPRELLEAHLLDFDGNLYGRKIEVALHAFIRDERKF